MAKTLLENLRPDEFDRIVRSNRHKIREWAGSVYIYSDSEGDWYFLNKHTYVDNIRQPIEKYEGELYRDDGRTDEQRLTVENLEKLRPIITNATNLYDMRSGITVPMTQEQFFATAKPTK
jgi:hypothetical protein